MESAGWVALGGFVTICASALALVVKQLESSRCTEIDSCCIRCKRKVPEPDSLLYCAYRWIRKVVMLHVAVVSGDDR